MYEKLSAQSVNTDKMQFRPLLWRGKESLPVLSFSAPKIFYGQIRSTFTQRAVEGWGLEFGILVKIMFGYKGVRLKLDVMV